MTFSGRTQNGYSIFYVPKAHYLGYLQDFKVVEALEHWSRDVSQVIAGETPGRGRRGGQRHSLVHLKSKAVMALTETLLWQIHESLCFLKAGGLETLTNFQLQRKPTGT